MRGRGGLPQGFSDDYFAAAWAPDFGAYGESFGCGCVASWAVGACVGYLHDASIRRYLFVHFRSPFLSRTQKMGEGRGGFIRTPSPTDPNHRICPSEGHRGGQWERVRVHAQCGSVHYIYSNTCSTHAPGEPPDRNTTAPHKWGKSSPVDRLLSAGGFPQSGHLSLVLFSSSSFFTVYIIVSFTI